MDRNFKVLCERFAMGLDQLRSSWQAGSISHDTFKDICKSIAQEVLRVRCGVDAWHCSKLRARLGRWRKSSRPHVRPLPR